MSTGREPGFPIQLIELPAETQAVCLCVCVLQLSGYEP